MNRTDDGQQPAAPAPNPYQTGEPVMDAEHLRMFAALERLEESLQGPYPLETLGDRLRQLETLTLEHFRSEEDLMASHGYPHLHLHQAEHEVVIDQCHDLLAQFIGPDSPPLADLAARLKVLFFRHIEMVDMDYVSFLELRRRSAEPPTGC